MTGGVGSWITFSCLTQKVDQRERRGRRSKKWGLHYSLLIRSNLQFDFVNS